MFGAVQRASRQLRDEVVSAYSQAAQLINDAICWRKFLPTFLYLGITTGLFWHLISDEKLEDQRILVLSGISGLLLALDLTLRLTIFTFGGDLSQELTLTAHQCRQDGMVPTSKKFAFYLVTFGPLRSAIKSLVVWLYRFCTQRIGETFVILCCLICGSLLELQQIQYAMYFSVFSVVTTLLAPPLVYREVPQMLWSQLCDLCVKVETFSILLFFGTVGLTLSLAETSVENAVALKDGVKDLAVGTVRFSISFVVNTFKFIRFVIVGIINGVIGLIMGIYHGIVNAIWTVKCAIVNGVVAVKNAIVRTVTKIVTTVVNTYRAIVNGIVNGAVWCRDSVCFVCRTVRDGVVNAVVTIKNAIVNTVVTICTAVKNFCVAVVTTVTNFCLAVKNGFIRLVTGIRDGILAVVYGVKRAIVVTVETVLAGPKAVRDGLVNLAVFVAVETKNLVFSTIQSVKDGVQWVQDTVLYGVRWSRDTVLFLLSTAKRKVIESLCASRDFAITTIRRGRDAIIRGAQWCATTARKFAALLKRKIVEMATAVKLAVIGGAKWTKQQSIACATEVWRLTRIFGNWLKRKALVALLALWDWTCLYAAQLNVLVKDYVRNTWLEPIYLLLHELKEAIKRYLEWKYRMVRDHVETVWIQPAVEGVKWRCEAIRSYVCEVVGGTASFILEDLLRPSVKYVADKIPSKAPYLEEDSDEELEGFIPTEDFPLDLKVEPDGILQGSDSEDEESYAPVVVESVKRRLSEPLHTDDSDDERDREGLAEVPAYDQSDSEDEFDLPKYSLPSINSAEQQQRPKRSSQDSDRSITPPSSNVQRKFSEGPSISESLRGMASQAYGAATAAATNMIVSRMMGGGLFGPSEPSTQPGSNDKDDESDPEFELIGGEELEDV